MAGRKISIELSFAADRSTETLVLIQVAASERGERQPTRKAGSFFWKILEVRAVFTR